MQVDVHADAVTVGDTEDEVELLVQGLVETVGSMPPIMSTGPVRAASSRSSAVPGVRMTPCCGKATIWTSSA